MRTPQNFSVIIISNVLIYITQKWVEKLVPDLKVSELTRTMYQQLLNDYAKEHERQTTLDFHHQLKGAILDAVDE